MNYYNSPAPAPRRPSIPHISPLPSASSSPNLPPPPLPYPGSLSTLALPLTTSSTTPPPDRSGTPTAGQTANGYGAPLRLNLRHDDEKREPGPSRLHIPPGNVPGYLLDDTQSGSWNTPPPRPPPLLHRASIPENMSKAPCTPPPVRPRLGLSTSSGSRTPALSLAIPALAGGSGGSSDSLKTPLSSDAVQTPIVDSATARYQRPESALEQKTMTHMTSDIRNALEKMNIAPEDDRRRTRSRASSASSQSLEDNIPRKISVDGLDANEYEFMQRLGEGAGGHVDKVREKSSGRVMALKVIPTSPNPSIHKQILRELQFLNECHSPYIVDHYGSFLTRQDSCIGMLMEYCEAGSLDYIVRQISKRRARTSEKVLGKIAESMLRGLDYLHERRIIHRDIKPSNVLVTKKGEIKLCDFGVSGELVNSEAGTFVGTSFYMAPERIQGLAYSIKSDVWSVGLTLHEVAHNRFPFPPEGEPPLSGPIELLNFIVAQPVPRLIDSPAEGVIWSQASQNFLARCLIRNATDRPYPRDLLLDPWIEESSRRNINLAKWVAAITA